MYTAIISALFLVAWRIVLLNPNRYKAKPFLFWLLFSCLVGWIEFITMLRFTPSAWFFDPNHITGLKIFKVTIEDYIFCPCFSVIFYEIYYRIKPFFKQRTYNPSDKLLFTIILIGISLFYYDIGSQFSKYMALRMALGLVGLIYCWNYVSFRFCGLFLLIVYVIAFGWDLPSVNWGIWRYVCTNGEMSQVYAQLTVKIFNAVFPVELFSYYLSGGLFSFGLISFFEKYFSEQKRLV